MSEQGDKLRGNLLDPMSRRPWLDSEGRSWVTSRRQDEVLVSRPSELKARLLKEEWIAADRAVLKAFRERAPLTCWLMKQSLFDMKGQGAANLPLPITHIDLPFDFDAELKARSGVVGKLHMADGTVREETINPTREGLFEGTFLEMCKAAGRRLGEAVERTLLDGWAAYGRGIPGLTNCGKPVRFGGTIKTSSAIKLLHARKFYGPYVVATDADVNTYDQRKAEKATLVALGGVQDVIATPALKVGEQVIVQCTPDVVRIVLGMDVTLMQWQGTSSPPSCADDGFKVACIIVPQVRCDCHGNAGVAVRRGA